MYKIFSSIKAIITGTFLFVVEILKKGKKC